ncbi:hypothetical protein JG687_00016553 [Phytophthora cactorum]|uniref:Uncharacterized protein n=1 Tax=Phytophthora cactorum TaxID=29920 RepID=A0A329RYA6_9STRA|nr:hypothetical protein Pcac1_g609 [Phytophthora cactorum]KAG2817993.1 hypothetical protein PC112_g12810 [Phytophthora cactorum]KAG2831785.1 hypothetical protein PC111_g6867 [Phytophthora cactorum]KAG2855919.1 hypothetical protein PC113_g12019 [Phytophthora cactorum]KAG2912698.1 hypothetical protein PC115_g12257 [Phytophthora cactorum]
MHAPAVASGSESEPESKDSVVEVASPQTLDSFGIPLYVKHSKRENSAHDIWEYGRDLDIPITRRNGKGKVVDKRNICALCVEMETTKARHGANAWKTGLCSTVHKSKCVITLLSQAQGSRNSYRSGKRRHKNALVKIDRSSMELKRHTEK